jgi:CPA2 family monovalent cation:H+ antiporter-2
MAAMEATAPTILEIGLVLLVAAAAGWLARKAGLPAIAGYLLVGLLVSPFTPGYVADRESLGLLADIGVVLLLFEVGIEIDTARLGREHGPLLWAAPLQVVISAVLAFGLLAILGVAPAGAALVGLGIAMSSSVVIVNITRSRRRTTDRATERALLGWSVLQDVTGVAFAVLILAVAGFGDRTLVESLARAAAFGVVAVVVAGLLPRVLRGLREQPDLFLIVSVAAGLAVAGIGAAVAGIPLALAAFVAGLAVAEGPDAREARRRLLPFRDLLAVLFFVVIGMLIDPTSLVRGLPWLGVLVALLVVAKGLVIWVLARSTRLVDRPLQLAVGLSQVGEFSFVLASTARGAGLVDDALYAAVLGTVVLSTVASAVGVRRVGRARTRIATRTATGPEAPQ